MRLPQQLESSPLFLFEDPAELILALGDRAKPGDAEKIGRLFGEGLPPIISEDALALMIGVNSGLIWSFVNRSRRHYRTFTIPKGNDVRTIHAPRVALKTVQKWLSVHLSHHYQAPDHVFGFVPNRSHIEAAAKHVGADWAYSADIENFFGTTPENYVADAFGHLGYDPIASRLCARLTCLGGFLAQGAPSSPVLSNICFRLVDEALAVMAEQFGCRVSRYADDIVFSGKGAFNSNLKEELHRRMLTTPWRLAPHKDLVQPIKGRIKIHGLLISQEDARLTKGYRNQIRAYSHILATKGLEANEAPKLRGHIEYARQVHRITGSPTGISTQSEIRLAGVQSVERASQSPSERQDGNLSVFDRLRRIFT